MLSITNANVNFPRSCCSVCRRIVLNGSPFDNPMDTMIDSASTEYPWPTRNSRPYTDEYHVGSSDMTQKTAPAVMVSEYTTIPGTLMFSTFLIQNGVFTSESASRFSASEFSRHV